MRYIKEYKLFESKDYSKYIYDIKNCFLHVSDLTKVKIGIIKGQFLGATGIEVSIDLNHLVSDEKQVSKFGVEYRVVKNGDELATLIADSIDQCRLINGIELKTAMVSWKNAGEWGGSGKSGLGPGYLQKFFAKNGIVDSFDNPIRGKWDLSVLSDFIDSKGNMLRSVKLYFKII